MRSSALRLEKVTPAAVSYLQPLPPPPLSSPHRWHLLVVRMACDIAVCITNGDVNTALGVSSGSDGWWGAAARGRRPELPASFTGTPRASALVSY